MTNAEKQKWNAEQYARNARFVAKMADKVLELLSPESGERILDLGCGDGDITLRLKQAGVNVTGIDASTEMVEASKKLGLDVMVMPAEELSFKYEFDAVFTNAVLHWVNDIDKVLAGVARALKPNGRFIGEFGGHGNVAAVSTAIIAALDKQGVNGAKLFPWYFPTAEEFSEKLTEHGFIIEEIGLYPRRTPLKTGMKAWLETFANPFLEGLNDHQKQQAINDAVEFLRTSLCDRQDNWSADYVRLRFSARLK